MTRVEYAGWNCVRYESGSLVAIVTLDVGPRVISLSFEDGPNLFFEKLADRGKVGGDSYRGYGGHRLWIAPEDRILTYLPDNDAVSISDGWITTCGNGGNLVKSIRLWPIAHGFKVEHRVMNLCPSPVRAAPWAISVMRPGGTCLIQRPSFRQHSKDALLPTDSLALWSYTDLTDPRYSFGDRLVTVKQELAQGPSKIGAFVPDGWAAYCSQERDHSITFVKCFPAEPGDYPDRGCNFECFSREDLLEIESLGRLKTINPNETAYHDEYWSVLSGAETAPISQVPLIHERVQELTHV